MHMAAFHILGDEEGPRRVRHHAYRIARDMGYPKGLSPLLRDKGLKKANPPQWALIMCNKPKYWPQLAFLLDVALEDLLMPVEQPEQPVEGNDDEATVQQH